MKASARIEDYDVGRMKTYANACASTLARSPTQDPVTPSRWLAISDRGTLSPEALAAFAVAYERQNAARLRGLRRAHRIGNFTLMPADAEA